MFKSFHQKGLFMAFLLLSAIAHGQLLDGKPERFTRQDSLRGALRPERTCFNVRHYALDLDLNFDKQYLDGAVKMTFDIVEPTKRMQLDLFENMELVDVLYESPGHGHSHAMAFEREGNAFFVSFPHVVQPSKDHVFYISYRGKPIVAKNAPWDGGFTWSEDDNGLPWLGVSCEGIGASLWWPNKDHLSDEPDSISVRVTYPEEITFVGNGRLVEDIFYGDGRRSTTYATSYPINNYNVTLNIGDYVHIEDEYTYPDGDQLALDYYVLSYNEAKAKEHFGQVKPMLECFNQYLGKYPFMVDGFALVETPYLGMEHQ
ncbi:MAG: M1 family peptidase, partial [Bacteroidota bacterium]|nr:M1 family peptidase [Bacteroidota bacterium]